MRISEWQCKIPKLSSSITKLGITSEIKLPNVPDDCKSEWPSFTMTLRLSRILLFVDSDLQVVLSCHSSSGMQMAFQQFVFVHDYSILQWPRYCQSDQNIVCCDTPNFCSSHCCSKCFFLHCLEELFVKTCKSKSVRLMMWKHAARCPFLVEPKYRNGCLQCWECTCVTSSWCKTNTISCSDKMYKW